MTDLQNVIFALGPNESYFFNTPMVWFQHNLPEEMADFFRKDLVVDVAVLALGPRTDSYFMRYKHKGGDQYNSLIWADTLPKKLLNWLLDDGGHFRRDRESVQVVLGPNEAFFAWDKNSVRWSNIPIGLEELIQDWLSPAGWSMGPPRIVALGKGGAYLAVSQYGAWGYQAPDSCPSMKSSFEAAAGLELFSSVEKAFMNPSVLDSWILLRNNTHIHGHNTISSEHYRQAAKSIATPDVAAIYETEWQEEEETQQNDRRKEEEDRKRQSEQERRQREQQETREKERQRRSYQEWHTKCVRLFEGRTPITAFPHLPDHHCDCTEPLCLTRKQQYLLKACRHDVEKLLRASGLYSVTWLRTERLVWHPDRFLRKCSPDKREEMQKKATEMYAIFEELISSEPAEGS